MNKFINSVNEEMKKYFLSETEINKLKKYAKKQYDNGCLLENDPKTFLKIAAKDLNIKLILKYKNIYKYEFLFNRISIIFLIVLIVFAIFNTYLGLFNNFYLIIPALILITILNITDRNYYVASILFFVTLLSVLPILYNLDNTLLELIFIFLVSLSIYYIFNTYKKKKYHFDNQTHLYEFSDYEQTDNYFTQKLGEKYIKLCEFNDNEFYFDNSIGKFTVDLREIENKEYKINVINEFAEFDFIVNENFNYNVKIKTNIGEVKYIPTIYNKANTITISGINNFGYIYFIKEQ